MSDQLRDDFMLAPRSVAERLIKWLPDAQADELTETRHGFVDIGGYLKRRSPEAYRESLRCARLTEWEMARRWPVKPSTGSRSDDRPLLRTDANENATAWQRIYAVGRCDQEWLATTDEILTQRKVIQRVERAAKLAAYESGALGRRHDVRHGDFRDALATVPDETVAAVITDPPYDISYSVIADMAKLSARVLIPGGHAVVMTPHAHIDGWYHALDDHLRYRWIGAWVMPHHHARMRLGFTVGFKPLLFFTNGPTNRPVHDTVTSSAQEKVDHDWQQNLDGFAQLIDDITDPGDLVMDPFLGAGTTAVACKQTSRRWVGADTDPAAIAATLARIAS